MTWGITEETAIDKWLQVTNTLEISQESNISISCINKEKMYNFITQVHIKKFIGF